MEFVNVSSLRVYVPSVALDLVSHCTRIAALSGDVVAVPTIVDRNDADIPKHVAGGQHNELARSHTIQVHCVTDRSQHTKTCAYGSTFTGFAVKQQTGTKRQGLVFEFSWRKEQDDDGIKRSPLQQHCSKPSMGLESNADYQGCVCGLSSRRLVSG